MDTWGVKAMSPGILCPSFFQVVSEDREKIRAEEVQCKEMAANAQKDLDEALPALEEALMVGLCRVEDTVFLRAAVSSKNSSAPSSSSSRLVGSGVSEQKGHDRDQVLRPSSSSGGDSDAGRHDPAGQRSILGRGQEAAG